MRNITGNNINILASENKTVVWLLSCNGSYWSHTSYSYDGQTYLPIVIPDSISGIRQARNKSELGIHASNSFKFSLSNKDNTIRPQAFEGEELEVNILISAWIGNQLFEWGVSPYGVGFADTGGVEWHGTDGATWELQNGYFRYSFRVNRVESSYQKLTFYCTDFIQQYLEGFYPNGKLLDSLAWNDLDTHNDQMCIAEPFGTVYCPIRTFSNSSTASRAYVLGPNAYTYDVELIRTPAKWGTGKPKEFTAASSDFVYYESSLNPNDVDGTKYDIFYPRIPLFDPEVSDGSQEIWEPVGRGRPDFIKRVPVAAWKNGNEYLDAPAKWNRSDLSGMTNPASVIRYVLEDFGVPSDKIYSDSFDLAAAKYDELGISFQGAFYMKQDRRKVLASLLNQCGSYITVSDTIDLNVFEKASVDTITESSILMSSPGNGSYNANQVTEFLPDSGYIGFHNSDEPQNELQKAVSKPKGTEVETSSEILELPFLNEDNRMAQRAGEMFFFRKLLREREISFKTLSHKMFIEPGDVATITGTNYVGTAGSWEVLIDEVLIAKDLTISFKCTKYSEAFFNWEDSTPATIVISTGNEVSAWVQPVTGGCKSTAVPDNIAGMAHEAFMRGGKFTWTPQMFDPSLLDYIVRFRVEANDKSPAGTWPGTWQSAETNNAFRFMTDAEQTTYGVDARIFCETKARNVFGDVSNSGATDSLVCLNLNVQPTDIDDFAVTASKVFTKIPVLSGDSWTDNTPATGFVSWNEHSIFYDGVQYTIPAASTSAKYIYWENAHGGYFATNTNPTLSDGDFIISTNISGYHDLAWNAIANEVIGSAYIQTASIQTAHIENLAVTNAKINDLSAAKIDTGYLSANRIEAATITAAKLSVSTLSAITADMGSITAGNITMATDGYVSSSTKTSYSSATAGFYLGYDTDDYKFNIGDSDTFLTWDGDTLNMNGILDMEPNDISGGFLNLYHSFFFGTNCGFPFSAATTNGGIVRTFAKYNEVYATGYDANSTALLSLNNPAPFKHCGFTAYIWVLLNSPIGVTMEMTYGDPSGYDYFGFRLKSDASIYAIASKSGNETEVEIDFTIPDSSANFSISTHYNSNDDTPNITFYCDGTLETTITNSSYLPTTEDDKRFVTRIRHLSGAANAIELKLYELSLWCDWPGQSTWGGRYKSG